MVFRLSPPNMQFANSLGVPLAGGKLFFYSSGTSAFQATYSDSALTVANPNPILLDSGGYAGDIFLLQGQNYKIVLQDANGVQIWVADPVSDPTSSGQTVTPFLAVNGAAGLARSVFFQTVASNRFAWAINASPESGANAGSDLVLNSYDDTGTLLNNIMSVKRSTGAISILTNISFANPLVFNSAINAQTGASYTIVAADQNKLVTRTNAAALADTIPQATGTFTTGFWFYYQNVGSTLATLTPTTSTINGRASLIVPPNYGILIFSDGVNWQILGPDPTKTGRILLNTLTANNSATLADLTSLTANFNHYEIVFDNILPATNAVICEMQLHSGGAYQTTGYLGTNFISSSSGIASGASTTYIPCAGINTAVSSTDPGVSGSIFIHRPSNTTTKKMLNGEFAYNTAVNPPIIAIVSGFWNGGVGAIDGFQVLMSAGNITSGVIYVYGWN